MPQLNPSPSADPGPPIVPTTPSRALSRSSLFSSFLTFSPARSASPSGSGPSFSRARSLSFPIQRRSSSSASTRIPAFSPGGGVARPLAFDSFRFPESYARANEDPLSTDTDDWGDGVGIHPGAVFSSATRSRAQSAVNADEDASSPISRAYSFDSHRLLPLITESPHLASSFTYTSALPLNLASSPVVRLNSSSPTSTDDDDGRACAPSPLESRTGSYAQLNRFDSLEENAWQSSDDGEGESLGAGPEEMLLGGMLEPPTSMRTLAAPQQDTVSSLLGRRSALSRFRQAWKAKSEAARQLDDARSSTARKRPRTYESPIELKDDASEPSACPLDLFTSRAIFKEAALAPTASSSSIPPAFVNKLQALQPQPPLKKRRRLVPAAPSSRPAPELDQPTGRMRTRGDASTGLISTPPPKRRPPGPVQSLDGRRLSRTMFLPSSCSQPAAHEHDPELQTAASSSLVATSSSPAVARPAAFVHHSQDSSADADAVSSPMPGSPASSALSSAPASPTSSSYSTSVSASPERRTFPSSVPLDTEFEGFYRRFHVPSPLDPEIAAQLECALGPRPPIVPGGQTTSQYPLKGPLDLYTPRWLLGSKNERVAICPVCYEDDGTVISFRTKISSYNRHMLLTHGISPKTGLPFSPPIDIRTTTKDVSRLDQRATMKEGRCHVCKLWVPIHGVKDVGLLVPEIVWFKHAQACHKGSGNFDGERDFWSESELLEAVRGFVESAEDKEAVEGWILP